MGLTRTIAIALAAACSTLAQAGLVKISFEGDKSPGSTAPNVFGESVVRITGHALYESNTAGVPFGTTLNGRTFNYAGAVREFAFDVLGDQGQSVFSGKKTGDAGFGSAQVRDGSTGIDRFSLNNIYLAASEVTGEPAVFSQAQFTLGLANDRYGIGLPGPELPDLFDPAVFNGQRNLSLFIARPAGSPSTGINSFNFNFTTVRVEAISNDIPEPAGAALVAAGLASFLVARRRRL